jgi:hypothetical protein
VLCLVVQVGILLVADCGLLKRRAKKTVPSTSKVMPLPALQQEQSKVVTLKQVRLKHGAASAESQAAAQKIQVQKNKQKRAITEWDVKELD